VSVGSQVIARGVVKDRALGYVSPSISSYRPHVAYGGGKPSK